MQPDHSMSRSVRSTMTARRTAQIVASWSVGLVWSSSAAAAPADLRLLGAVKNRDITAVNALLKQRVDVNARQLDGSTALHWAVYWDDVALTDLLVRAGANVNLVNDLGVT